MRQPRILMIAALFLLGLAQTAGAQVTPVRPPGTPPPRPRGPRTHFVRISVNGGISAPFETVDESVSPVINVESAPTDASFALGLAPLVEGGADVRIKRRIAVGVSVSFERGRSSGDVTSAVPHPFYFNMPRSVSGSFSNLEGRTIAIHPYARWFRPVSRRLELSISGGPSIFILRQEFITSVLYDSTYPFDSATFRGVDTTTLDETGFGAHVGADLAYTLTKKAALGVLARYAAGNVSFAPVGNATTTVRAGGLQVAGGLRITF